MHQLIAEKASLKGESDRWRKDRSELKVFVCTLVCHLQYLGHGWSLQTNTAFIGTVLYCSYVYLHYLCVPSLHGSCFDQ